MAAEALLKTGLDGFAAFRSISTLQPSPDDRALCMTVHQPDLEKNRNRSELWVYTPEGGHSRLTTSESDRHPRWLNDSELIFISQRRSESTLDERSEKLPWTTLYTIDIRGGEAAKALEIPLEVLKFECLDDGRFLLEFTYHPEWHGLTEEKEILEKIEEKATVQILDEIPFWHNGSGFTNKTRTALGLYDPQLGTTHMLTDQLSNVEDWVLDRPRQRVILIQSQFKNKQVVYNSLSLCSLEDKTIRDISHRDDFIYQTCAVSPDGQVLFYGSDASRHGLNENGAFYLMEGPSLTVRRLTEDFDGNFGNSVGTDIRVGSQSTPRPLYYQGAWLFVSTVEAQAPLMAILPDGTTSRWMPEDQDVACYEFTALGEELLAVALIDQRPQELYQLLKPTDPKEDSEASWRLKPLTQLNQKAYEAQFVSIPEPFSFLAKDGTPLSGWIMKPFNFDPLRRYTCILNIHGGPKTAYGPFYYHEMQYWASEGFAVIFMNPRGSEGRGNDFADLRGKYGHVDYEDLMAFVDAVTITHPWIDNDRMGVTGGSYGGFMTNWIIGHTHRFKAAASQRSISNWISKFGTTDIGYYFVPDQIGADPWSDFEQLWDRSPLKYADQVKTPTLFLHSDEDYRCWTAEAFQMFTALKYHGIQSRLCLFHGENHELSRSGKPKNRCRRLKEITDWMRTFL